MRNLLEFPIELQEMILSRLDPPGLLTASRVCKLWYELSQWLVRERYSEMIPEECFQEITESGVPEDELWLTAANFHHLQMCVPNQMLNQKKSVVVELNDKHFCFCIHGPLVVVGSVLGDLTVYNTEEAIGPVMQLRIGSTPILQVEVMTSFNVLFVRTLNNEVIFTTLPFCLGKTWLYKMTFLKPRIFSAIGSVTSKRNFSISGNVFIVVTSERQVTVFEVVRVAEEEIELKYLKTYAAEYAVNHVSLWREEAIMVFREGGTVTWNLSSLKEFGSIRYYELHYENPMWVFRGRIFCSTIISSELLGYWNRGTETEYWLIGKPTHELVRCRDLGRTLALDLNGEDVLCVCLKQRLLACGTRNGQILIYILSNTFFSSKEFDVNGNVHVVEEFKRAPDLVIRTKERPISNLQVQFNENSIVLYAWPCRMHSRPEQKGLLQRIVLEEIKPTDSRKPND